MLVKKKKIIAIRKKNKNIEKEKIATRCVMKYFANQRMHVRNKYEPADCIHHDYPRLHTAIS